MDKEFDSRLGQRIQNYRLTQNLTQGQLAARMQTQGCDLTRSAIAKIEVGQRRISVREVRDFCIALEISYEALLDE
ncbi:MAG: helix-turn-helix transcriptional regulator [Clostridiales bacterium]|nr:helix-turn-helix transcriptional regulator [Clostridiales bacterium]